MAAFTYDVNGLPIIGLHTGIQYSDLAFLSDICVGWGRL